ncbi:ABC transporter permease [Emticicia sp. BO119]|uniref:ABC transporter permease n=1 Tax=Emticicia sp. BO119 TaxID=2757768 RepID=UPI0015F02CC6|nr:ABC transporter permease [Emticicia sp. BO119]MBA4850052.1 ABC transporter permease [Emticicia sp. BO119]
MIINYFKIALRNLLKYKGYSTINILGLATGMAVAILIGLWVYDELSFNKYHKNYNRIAQVMQNLTNNGGVSTQTQVPYPLAEELRKNYGADFKHIILSSQNGFHTLTKGETIVNKTGTFFEPGIVDLLSLNIIKGNKNGLNEPNSVILSESLSKVFFGEADPIDKIIKIDNDMNVKVTAVYEDLPKNTSFGEVAFMAPWELLYTNAGLKSMTDPWRPNAFEIYTQLNDNADIDKVSFKIRDAKLKKVNPTLAKKKPELFLLPMSRWHLYSEYKNGVNTGGRIQYVWLFGIISIFVLLLACINFMNLSTARSEKRAKEVGIRKAIGSVRVQLILQFFSESLLVVILSFTLSLIFVQLSLPAFNEIADKKMNILWTSTPFWLACLGFCVLTGFIAGSYPAFYLSSFQPIKVLKGTFSVGRFASIPRKVLVVMQFSVSVTLIIGTIVIFKQIQFAKNRPLGYETNGLVSFYIGTNEIHKHFDAIKRDLVESGAIIEMAESSSPTTNVWGTSSGFDWRGKDPNMPVDIAMCGISYDYAKTIGLQFKEGRNFSRDFASDSSGLVLNEAAVKFMGLQNPVGETIKWFDRPYKVIGVAKNIVIQSPYEPVKPVVYFALGEAGSVVLAKINSASSAKEAIDRLEATFKEYNPTQPFEYQFVDEDYNKKFANEERIGKLATFFAILAIFISCLGLFGLASFVAEQRTKEIGVRKVLGASVFNLWRLLSKDFIVLVLISLFIASPIAYYFMSQWIEKYTYRTDISWWIFAAASLGALLITLLTVSFQAIKAALMNPVKSLKTE